MPNFVKVDSKPFHPDTYVGPEHDDDELQQGENVREKSMTIKLKVENTLRWRWIKDELGNDVSVPDSLLVHHCIYQMASIATSAGSQTVV
jgi:RNA polymerase-associated protein LEO1